MKFKTIFPLLLVLIIASCTIHKRHYAKGFYIQLHPFHHATNHLKGEKNSEHKLEELEPNGILTENDTTRINSRPSTKLSPPSQPTKVKKAQPTFEETTHTLPQTQQNRDNLDHILHTAKKKDSTTFIKRHLNLIIQCLIGFVAFLLLAGIFDYLASVQKEKYKLKVYAILLGIFAPLTLVFLYFGWDLDIFLAFAGISLMIACISLALLIVFSIINGRIDRENEHNNRVEEIKNESKSTPVTEPVKPTDPTPASPSTENLDLKLAWLNADEAVQKKNRQIVKLVIAFVCSLLLSGVSSFFAAFAVLIPITIIVMLLIRLDKVDQRKKALRNLENTTSPSGN